MAALSGPEDKSDQANSGIFCRLFAG